MSIAIVYGSGITKHTKAISEYIGTKTGADVFNAKGLTDFDFEKYDTIVIGTNVYAGFPNKHAMNFVKNNSENIARKKTFLFISCMYNGEKGQRQAEKIASSIGIGDFRFFSTKDGKNADGSPKGIDEFVSLIQ